LQLLGLPLLHIANKLLGRQNLNFEQLTSAEQKLWNLFENADIYEFLTGEKDTTPEFRHDKTCGAKTKISFNLQGFANDLAKSNINLSVTQQPVQRASSTPAQVQHFCQHLKQPTTMQVLHWRGTGKDLPFEQQHIPSGRLTPTTSVQRQRQFPLYRSLQVKLSGSTQAVSTRPWTTSSQPMTARRSRSTSSGYIRLGCWDNFSNSLRMRWSRLRSRSSAPRSLANLTLKSSFMSSRPWPRRTQLITGLS